MRTAQFILVVNQPAVTGLSATAVSPTQVNLVWNAYPGASQYVIYRARVNNTFNPLAPTGGATSYPDTSVTGGNAYAYTVLAFDASNNLVAASDPDIATTIFFTDDPIVAGVTPVRAIHLTELRNAVKAIATVAGQTPPFTDDPLPAGTPIKAVHINELRFALSNALNTIGIFSRNFTDPTLTPGVTPLKAVHIQELRDACK